MTKAELTAENRPAYEDKVRPLTREYEERRTNIRVELRSSSYFLT